MANKCCSCSRFFSCLSCFSRGNDPDAIPPVEGTSSSDALPPVEGTSCSDVPAVMEIPSVGSSSSAIEEGNVDDVNLDALLEDVSNLLEQIKEGTKSSHKKTKTAQQYLPTTSKSFIKLKEFLSEAANFVKDIVPGDAIKTVASGILQGMGMAHLATAGLVVVVSILERFDEVSANKSECLRFLREMIFLAKLVKQFKERCQLKEAMHDVIREATELIVESSIKCLAHMKSSKFSKSGCSKLVVANISHFSQGVGAPFIVVAR